MFPLSVLYRQTLLVAVSQNQLHVNRVTNIITAAAARMYIWVRSEKVLKEFIDSPHSVCYPNTLCRPG